MNEELRKLLEEVSKLEDKDTVYLCFTSDFAVVPGMVRAGADFVEKLGGRDMPDVQIVLRELFFNAIEHGNHNDAGKLVLCRISQHAGEVELSVTDEGFGNVCNKDSSRAYPRENLQRGLVLVQSLSDTIEVNDAGNCVTVRIRHEAPGAGALGGQQKDQERKKL